MSDKDLNQPEVFYDMSEEDRKTLLDWISCNLIPIKSFNTKHSSYRLKHILEADIGFYCTNGEFKGAMLESGYKVQNRNELNWNFNVSAKSPGIVRYNKKFI